MRRFRTDWPVIYKAVRFTARTLMGRKNAPAVDAGEARTTGQPAEQAAVGFSQSLDDSYQRWIDEQEPSAEGLNGQRQSEDFLNGPIISIIVPVHQTDHSILQACIQSVTAQTYPRWELCVAITPGGDSRNQKFLHQLAKQDQRIRLIDLSENGGISGNTNAALNIATGEFIALLDHDDALAPFALFEVAIRLKGEPDADIIYSDHDYLDAERGFRCNPLFKPDWSPSIMFSANYITHLTLLRRSLLERIGRFDSATDGAQDWDLFLRATEETRRISHIPKILRRHSDGPLRDTCKDPA
jgi:hypothetical protein